MLGDQVVRDVMNLDGSADEMQGADNMPAAWLMGYKMSDEVKQTEGGAAARVAAKEFAAPGAPAYETDSGGDKNEFGDVIANDVNFDQGVKKGVVQTGTSLAVSGRKMILLFLVSMIGSVSAVLPSPLSPPMLHHAPSAPPIKKTKVAAALGLTAVAGKKIMDKVPDDLMCFESEVPMCEMIVPI